MTETEKNANSYNKCTDNDLENHCFVMMPISNQIGYDEDDDHFTKVYEQIFTPAIKKAGFVPYRVDDNKISDSIINKIFIAVQNCPMALCDLSSKNPNVLYELGLRQAYDMPVVLVKDEKTGSIFDVSGINTVEYNSHRLVENVQKAINDIAEALIATKDGNETTVAKIVKAKVADFSNVEVSKEDNTNILFNKIMTELKNIKNNQDNVVVNYKNISSENKPCFSETAIFKIRKGITNKEIADCIEFIENGMGAKIVYSRKGNYLSVMIKHESIAEAQGLMSWLKYRLEADDEL